MKRLALEARAKPSCPGGRNEGFPDTFKQLQKKIYDTIRAGDTKAKPDFPTFADGHYEMQLCEAILTSAKECRWVDVQGPAQRQKTCIGFYILTVTR